MANITSDSKALKELRRKIRMHIQEASSMEDQGQDQGVGNAGSAADGVTAVVASPSGTLTVSRKPDMTLQSTIVEIAKSAAYGMERIELLKKRDFPTHKSANAVGTAVDALEMIFKDMLRNPMAYLDEDPADTVAKYENYLDDEATKLKA